MFCADNARRAGDHARSAPHARGRRWPQPSGPASRPANRPSTAAKRSIPKWSATLAWAAPSLRRSRTGKAAPQGLPVSGLMLAGPRRTEAGPQVVDADHEEPIGIHRLARALPCCPTSRCPSDRRARPRRRDAEAFNAWHTSTALLRWALTCRWLHTPARRTAGLPAGQPEGVDRTWEHRGHHADATGGRLVPVGPRQSVRRGADAAARGQEGVPRIASGWPGAQ